MGREIQVETQVRPAVRNFLLATSIVTFALIVIGVMVRVTGAGAACGGWPTCFGEWSPPPVAGGWIAFGHRLAAGLSGLMILIASLWAWFKAREQRRLVGPLTGAAGLILVQILVGGLTTLFSPGAHLTAIHLSLSLMVLSLVIIPTVEVVASFSNIPDERQFLGVKSKFGRLSLLTLAAVFVLMISGAVVSTSGAATVCSSWPLCNGFQFPHSTLEWLATVHRQLTALAGFLVTALFVRGWRTQRHNVAPLVASTIVVVLFYAQVLMGALEAANRFPIYLVGLHVATSVGIWAALIVLVTVNGMVRSESGAKLERMRPARGIITLAKDYLMLTKPIVVALLLVTTYAGMVIGGKSFPPLPTTLFVLLAGYLAAGGSSAINQYIDRYDDEKMQRTSARPIPAGRLTPGEGLAFGVAIALASFYLMVAFVNFLAALLTLAGIIYYVLLYSILLKKTTVQNIVIGGGAGAIPPLVGWAAVTGALNIPSLFLFAVVFMWTPPHFWALALVRRKDYARAGVPMLPVVRGERETRWQILLYTIELVALTLALPFFGLGGGVYLVGAVLLGAGLLFSAWRVWQGSGNKVAWKMYRHSSMYLAFLFLVLMVDAVL